eukprot:GHVS01036083.1.p1 GENE.GHVS01036083.1~~GHVS01036083.1.p1  ORF type:complete len:158 (+),score=7.14 GHVS01036083.1:294-767(+)
MCHRESVVRTTSLKLKERLDSTRKRWSTAVEVRTKHENVFIIGVERKKEAELVSAQNLPFILKSIREQLSTEKQRIFSSHLDSHGISIQRLERDYDFLYELLLSLRLNEAKKDEGLRRRWVVCSYGKENGCTRGDPQHDGRHSNRVLDKVTCVNYQF